MEKKNHLAYGTAILHAVITGLSFLFTKMALDVGQPLDILAHRFTASFIVVVILFMFNKVKLDLTMDKFKKAMPIAILYPFLFFAFQTFGLQNTTSAEAGILLALAPIFTLILAAILLKEKTTMLQKVSVVVSFLGVMYIVINKDTSSQAGNMKGIILLVLSAFSLALYSVKTRKLTQEFDSTQLGYFMIIIGFIAFNIIAVGNHLINGTIVEFVKPLASGKFIIAILYLGVLSSLLTALLNNYTLSKLEASKVGVFANLSTIVSMVAGVLFLSEKLYSYHIIGTILIITGVIGTNLLGKKRFKKE